ncbi:hypothetical protein FD754_018979 [Muntiacus muntjak]|uniref:NAC-A/B domain-containing protein n=1 Tax=Muntiacus muntjak TaxID=9888 RepID=A0A5N3UYX3_MUNMU|nr:hypothetical protein FD754_018979 [Muntiacus muntjak]
MKAAIMNQGKLAKLQARLCIVGKGTAHRKKKVVLTNATENNKKLYHTNNLKIQASLAANTFTIIGHPETKQMAEMLPKILYKLSTLSPKKSVDGKVPLATGEDDDDEVLDLDKNFDKAFKNGAN